MRYFIVVMAFVFGGASLAAIGRESAAPTGVNIALGKQYTFSKEPNYRGECRDPDDKVQLTDGKTTREYFWAQKGTVGWSTTNFVAITIDLGKMEPIDRVAFTTAAGAAQVSWPLAAFVHVSEDGKTFYEAGGNFLVYEQEQHGIFDNSKYSIRKLTSHPLGTKGRFVRLYILSSGIYTFTDEIEIIRGDKSLLAGAFGQKVSDSPEEYVTKIRLKDSICNRYLIDIAAIDEALHHASKSGQLKEDQRKQLQSRINLLRSRLLSRPAPNPKGFRAILPLCPDHAELLAMQGVIWRAAGMAPLTAEVVNRWELMPLVGRLPLLRKTTHASLDMLRGESRPFAVNLYNAEEKNVQITVAVKGSDSAPNVAIATIPWTDTNRNIPVQAAIMELAVRNGKSEAFPLLPGVPHQLWITFDSTGVPPGNYLFEFIIESDSGKKVSVKATVTVHPVDMPGKYSLLAGGWDDTDRLPVYSITEKCLDSFLQVCRSHHVNAPWGQNQTMFKCTLTGSPKKLSVDTKPMEVWLERWPDGKEYFVFLSVGEAFLGYRHGTAEFEHWVGEWAKFWGQWLKERKIDPARFSLLLHDEPGLGNDPEGKVPAKICNWARAIKRVNSGLRIWEDPVYADPTNAPPDLLQVTDTLCPNRPQWLANPEAFEKVYRGEQKKGKILHLYSCTGPFRLLDPYHYCLLQAWHCFQIDAKASFFWALGDAGGFSCWNEYVMPRMAYCPMFIDPDDTKVYSAKQMAAIKESVQDYETLRLLQEAIGRAKTKGVPADKIAHAQRVLKDGVTEVLSTPGSDKLEWQGSGERSAADQVRGRIIRELVELR